LALSIVVFQEERVMSCFCALLVCRSIPVNRDAPLAMR
jgi:hypothetical protein